MHKPSSLRLPSVALAASLLLAACGGGGGGGDSGSSTPTTPPSTRFGASSNYAGICTLDGQKQFIRAYMDEVYYWYNEIPDVDAAAFSNITDYFNALLVKTPDANGQPKDRFSAVLPTSAVAAALSQNLLPARATAVDSTALSLSTAVPQANVITSPGTGRKVGYIQFNDFSIGAQDELITDFRNMQSAGVQDLVLDLRFNSGGYLYIAQSTASMVTGAGNVGKTFEQLTYNDKRGAETAASRLPFINTVTTPESQFGVGTALPQLNLPRVYVLTSGLTCSASESVINSLRGVDVQVVTVGGTTCGKPYGFHQRNNCGYAYFPIEFKGTNNKGFGDYTTGFSPTCTVTDNRSTTPGSGGDPLFQAAIHHIDTGACPAGAATAQSSIPQLDLEESARPAWAGRILN
ncbi:hypothetical protein HHL11_26415 [Ramlibacter sp. G-1-2-2]|uniref:Peptidase S41 n=2 Tax=Ramlibacter agri TaxID=2728837 RepID=A0A848HCW2_9BURK|nr:hypothetical protein [Ramlibacter agri]